MWAVETIAATDRLVSDSNLLLCPVFPNTITDGIPGGNHGLAQVLMTRRSVNSGSQTILSHMGEGDNFCNCENESAHSQSSFCWLNMKNAGSDRPTSSPEKHDQRTTVSLETYLNCRKNCVHGTAVSWRRPCQSPNQQAQKGYQISTITNSFSSNHEFNNIMYRICLDYHNKHFMHSKP